MRVRPGVRPGGLALVAALAAGSLGAPVAQTLRTAPPTTEIRPFVDEYHGVTVTDPYRWLENWSDPAVRAWTDAQTEYARAQLDGLPFIASVRSRIKTLGTDTHPRWVGATYRGGHLFTIKIAPPHEQPMLVALAASAAPSTERIVVDPVRLDATGSTAIDFYAPSLDGRRVAVSLSKGGTESGDVHVFDTATGRELGDVVPRVNGGTAGGSVAWNADASGFFYTRYPRPGERPAADLDFYQQVFFHRVGTPEASDTYAIGKDFPRIAEIVLKSSPDGRFVLATVSNGDGGEHSQFVRGSTGRWSQLATYADDVVSGTWGRDDALYLLSRKGAPRGQVLRLPAGRVTSLAAARTVVRAGDGAIDSVEVTATRLYVHEVIGGPSRLRAFDLEGTPKPSVEVAPVSSVSELVGLARDEIMYDAESFVSPPAWYRATPGSAPTRTALAWESPADYSDAEVTRAEAISRDGTHVPLSIVMRKGTPRDGRNPTLLYGYGGYSISTVPTFSATRRILIEQSGIYVSANIRGGAEFGDEWHQAGKLTSKQNVFDDFAAVARYLIEQKYTSASSLAILGGSNGGLLMGAELTQHPELVRAVISQVGIYDMLRFETWPNGQFNTTEFGTVRDRAQFEALYAYSPYHHVVDRTGYPAVLMFSGANDPRVNPGDSRKFAARLQAATSSGRPVLLITSGTGHGFGTSLSAGLSQVADMYAFLFWQLGVAVR